MVRFDNGFCMLVIPGDFNSLIASALVRIIVGHSHRSLLHVRLFYPIVPSVLVKPL